MTPLNMNEEPLRLPAWAVGILLVVGPPVAAILLGAEWQEAVATAILGLVAGGGVVGAAESVRARTDSPATVERRLSGLAVTPLPEDERDHGDT